MNLGTPPPIRSARRSAKLWPAANLSSARPEPAREDMKYWEGVAELEAVKEKCCCCELAEAPKLSVEEAMGVAERREGGRWRWVNKRWWRRRGGRDREVEEEEKEVTSLQVGMKEAAS